MNQEIEIPTKYNGGQKRTLSTLLEEKERSEEDQVETVEKV